MMIMAVVAHRVPEGMAVGSKLLESGSSFCNYCL